MLVVLFLESGWRQRTASVSYYTSLRRDLIGKLRVLLLDFIVGPPFVSLFGVNRKLLVLLLKVFFPLIKSKHRFSEFLICNMFSKMRILFFDGCLELW